MGGCNSGDKAVLLGGIAKLPNIGDRVVGDIALLSAAAVSRMNLTKASQDLMCPRIESLLRVDNLLLQPRTEEMLLTLMD